ncbi:MAG: methionyl-tRNA formyltransferase [Bacteroidota bacterium]
MRIVFMGTPEFAVPSLDRLFQAGYEIAAVVTVPDKPAGRGKKLRPSAVKAYALEKELPLLQPVKLRDPAFIEALQATQADVFVVVAFRMLPKVVWDIPGSGTFNLHSSLLPDYRGAAPINWVVINGETQSGVTTFLIDEQIDTGNLLLQEAVEVPQDWTAGQLHDLLMEKGADLVLATVQGLEENRLSPRPQDDELSQHKAPKIFKEDCEIDWNQSAASRYNLIRGLSPYPTAWTKLGEDSMKVFLAARATLAAKPPAGSCLIEDGRWYVACADGWIELLEIQLAGKKRMKVADFLRGYKEEILFLG